MQRYLTLIILTMVMLFSASTYGIAETQTVKLYINDEVISIHFGSKMIYTIENVTDSYSRQDCLFSSQLLVEFKNKLAIQNKYLKIDNQTKIVKYRSSNESILTIKSNGSFKIKKIGKVIINISVDNTQIQIPLEIVGIPLVAWMTRDEVIEILGLPDTLNKKYVGWVESEYIDGIYYYANTNDGSGICVEHWVYKKYPNAILRFGYLGLKDCAIASWKEIRFKKHILEH